MKIVFSKHYLGSKIVAASMYIPKYTTKIITKTEVFDEPYGIIPSKVKIEMASQLLQTENGAHYKIIVTINNIVLIDKYSIIHMKVNYCFIGGGLVKIHLISNETGLIKNIETVIRQVLKNLDKE